ncbi:MAG: TonB-dependent receptor plug domain-containing protein [Gemmatimonadetes bacterium]|nr:TonB-dependent receptor plug domain-containing protein [Gemmatimonadota bacterium]
MIRAVRPAPHCRALAALTLASLLASAGAATGQDTTRARADTARLTPTPVPRPRVVPIPLPEVPTGPLPSGSRYVFTRDSIAWTSAVTLSDLLGAIPGVYLARAGFLGQAEYIAFAGRGAAALELYWDGLPVLPLGGDTVYVDPARVYLTTLRRVDVEVLPAALRVFLVSERHETLDTRSLVRVMSGDFATAQYAGLFQKRWPAGLGLDLAANFVGTDGASGPGRSDQAFDVWGRIEWLPTPRGGALYQFRRQTQDRSAVTIDGVLGSPARHGVRTDAQFKIFTSTGPDGRGLSAELAVGSGAWRSDSAKDSIPDQLVRQASSAVRYRGRRAAAELTGRLADRWVKTSLTGRGALEPVPGIVLSGDASVTRLSTDSTNRHGHAAVELQYGPFSLVGEIAYRHAVQASALPRDTVQTTLDRAARVGFTTRPLSGHVALVRRDAYAPLPFTEIRTIPGLARTPRSTYVVAGLKLQPIAPLTLDGWYAHPARGGADFQPPRHARAQLTFRSKFWRTFRSGAFDLKVQMAMESWSRGTAGLAAGSPIPLPGVTFWEGFISFQIVGFTAFYDLRNALNARERYVPGLPQYPRNAQTFGVRWEFYN